MKIHELVWSEDRIDHIASHGIEPEEVEDVCFGRSLVLRAKSKGKNLVYYVLGQTVDGRRTLPVLCSDSFSGWPRISRYSSPHDSQGEAAIQSMEKEMNKLTIPTTDSIEKLAEFWDTHDLTDFEDQLEEVSKPVFERKTETILVRLQPEEAERVRQIAQSRGIGRATLIRKWVLEKLHAA